MDIDPVAYEIAQERGIPGHSRRGTCMYVGVISYNLGVEDGLTVDRQGIES